LDFGADWADEANRPDGIKLLRNFCGIGAITLVKDYLACNSHRHLVRAMRHILRFAHWANAQISTFRQDEQRGESNLFIFMNKLLKNAAHFIGKAPVMWEGRYMDLPLLGENSMLFGKLAEIYSEDWRISVRKVGGNLSPLFGVRNLCVHFLRLVQI